MGHAPILLPMIAALPSSAHTTNCLHTTILQVVFTMYSKGQFWVYIYLITVFINYLSGALVALYLSLMLLTHFFHSSSWSLSEEKYWKHFVFTNLIISGSSISLWRPRTLDFARIASSKRLQVRIAAKLSLFLLFTNKGTSTSCGSSS